jgi:predicted permease
LLLASFLRILAIDPGFRPDRVMTAEVSLPAARYEDDAAIIGFANEALRRLRSLPGATAAGVTDTIPLAGSIDDSVILAEGYQMQPGESVLSPNSVVVSPGYFEAMGATLLRGRFFDTRDVAAGARSIIVDETLARRFWPGQDPVGRRMYRPTDINNLLAITDKTVFLTVVGVVRELKMSDLVAGSDRVGAYFFPFEQRPQRTMAFALSTPTDPASLAGTMREAIGGLDRELPVYGVRTMTERVERSLASRRTPVFVALGFAGIALLLSAIGVYGVLAYLVTQRTREFGIRMALGCSEGGVFTLVLREGLVLVGAGFAVGAAGVVALKSSLDSLLFGITAADPSILAAVAVLLACVAVGASSLPARRATRIDPVTALAK